MTLDQPVPPADYSNKYASRPLPQTPHSPSPPSSCPYNMSLARALDHNYDSQTESSPELAAHARDHCVDESESAAAVNVIRETSTRYILYYYVETFVHKF